MAAKSLVLLVSGINLLAGLWLIIVPYFYDFASMSRQDVGTSPESRATANMLVAGFVIVVIAAIRMAYAYRMAGYQRPTMWLSWLNLLVGLWLIIAPFVLSYSDLAGAFWNSIIVGAIVIVLGAWSAITAQSAHV